MGGYLKIPSRAVGKLCGKLSIQINNEALTGIMVGDRGVVLTALEGLA
jgi:hypothetical protein